VSPSKGFYDLLFEVSNEHRHGVLLLLQERAMRITDLAREMDLNNPEIRRHISRLRDVGLIRRDVEGYYSLTPYGETSLLLFGEFDFLSSNNAYFKTHTLSKIPIELVKQIGELGESLDLNDAMDFLRHTETLLRDSKEYVWLLVDQFPLNSLITIVEAIERGVQFRLIEPRERILNPDIESITSEEAHALSRTRQTPLVDQRMVDEVNAYLFLSDNQSVIAFPTTDGQHDYKGFTATDESSLKWCRKLFLHYWDKAEYRTLTPPLEQVERSIIPMSGESIGQILVVGRETPAIDVQTIQDAVDNYDEVILKGKFNLGTATIHIRRSVVIRGEGRENDIPSTEVYKRGWTFPFFNQQCLFEIDEGIDVAIENIHFTDFNYVCIDTRAGALARSVKIRNNRISLVTGMGRGMSFGNRGDHVIGLIVSAQDVTIEENYIDFARSYVRGGFVSRKGLETDPNFRPDLENHESYCGIGMILNGNVGKVTVRDNIIRNMNSRGIFVSDNYESADIRITGNTIESDVYGSYPYSSHMAGIGILAQSAWARPMSGSRVEIFNNKIRCNKLNYCGIAVYGPSMYQEGAGKLGECVVRDNDIHLGDGSVGVLIRKNDRTEVFDTKISGKAYYGFHLWGSRDREGFDLGSNENLIKDNDMTDLVIKAPDEYSDSHVDGRMFTGKEGRSATAHVWLNAFSKENVIKMRTDETVIDEGEDNKITHVDTE
jgi:predicted transcriptional regulator